MAKFGEVEETRMVMQKPERAKGITIIQAMQIDAKDVEEKTQTRMQVLQIAHRPDLKEEDFAIQEISN